MLSPEQARAFVNRWYAAWNAGDLDAIMACYDDGIEHSSPFIARFRRITAACPVGSSANS